MRYLLFKKSCQNAQYVGYKYDGRAYFQGGFHPFESITLRIFGSLYADGESHNWKTTVSRLRFALSSKGKARIFYVKVDGKVVHTSYVIPRCRKFPFLKENDFEIGPCCTDKEYRGLGIYPQVLNYIVYSNGAGGETYYMIVSQDNISSLRGIKKAGFDLCGEVFKTKLKKYKLLSNDVRGIKI